MFVHEGGNGNFELGIGGVKVAEQGGEGTFEGGDGGKVLVEKGGCVYGGVERGVEDARWSRSGSAGFWVEGFGRWPGCRGREAWLRHLGKASSGAGAGREGRGR